MTVPAAAVTCASPGISTSVGPVALRPSGFLETIAVFRSATTGNGISTRFGSIPLVETPGEADISLGHSRLELRGEMLLSNGAAGGYLESDFLNEPGRHPYRWRQYWGQFRWGNWEILGGQAWSLLRPSRSGICTETGLMSTHTVEPAYHVGVLGFRRRQLRIRRSFGAWQAAATYEEGGNWVAKVAWDRRWGHLEATGIVGHAGKRGFDFAAILKPGRRVDFVSQQFISSGAGPEIVGRLPRGVKAYATIQGVEARVRKSLEIYAYAGLAYADRSDGNRLLGSWSVGFIQRLFATPDFEPALSAMFSRIHRVTWDGRRAEMDYVMIGFRFTIPGAR